MKNRTLIYLIFLTAFFSQKGFSQAFNFGIYNGTGINLVDVEKSQGWELVDWNTYSNLTNIQGLFMLNEKLQIGGEVGAHRLYYWERRSPNTGYYSWGTMWTYNVDLLAAASLNEKIVFKAGIGMRTYSDASGSAFAGLASIEYELISFGKFTIPIGLRTDLIMANATTSSINLFLGICTNK